MRILFLCRFLPHRKARDSGRQDTYHYVHSLSERHDVSLIAFVSENESEALPEVEQICDRVVAIPYSHNGLTSRLRRAFWRQVIPRVYGRNVSTAYRRNIVNLLTEIPFDAFIVDGQMASYIRYLHDGHIFLDEVDIYGQVAFSHYLNESNSIKKRLAKYDWQRTAEAELNYAAAADGVLVRSEKDLRYLQKRLPEVDITILPPWFEGLDELARISPSRPEGNIILFVGAMDILANQEAAIYFAREILPQVRDRLTDAEFYVVGNKPGPQVERLAIIDGVIVTGEVEALRPYYEKAAVNVVPLMTGGGIIVKTLNGMASGRPTIVSEAGNSGTEALNDEHLLVVTDGAEAFSDAVVKVLIDDKLWTRLAISGQSFIQNRYDWNTIIKDLEILIQKIAQ